MEREADFSWIPSWGVVGAPKPSWKAARGMEQHFTFIVPRQRVDSSLTRHTHASAHSELIYIWPQCHVYLYSFMKFARMGKEPGSVYRPNGGAFYWTRYNRRGADRKMFFSSRLAPFDIDDVKIDRVMRVDHESRREGSKNATSKFAECQHTNRRSLKGC